MGVHHSRQYQQALGIDLDGRPVAPASCFQGCDPAIADVDVERSPPPGRDDEPALYS